MATELGFMAPINTNTNTTTTTASDDMFEEKFRRFRNNRTKTAETTSSSGKYRPSPPPHSHNLATPVDEEENNMFLKNAKNKKKKKRKKKSTKTRKKPPSLITENTQQQNGQNQKLPLSPMQKWNLIQNKMESIVPYIQSFNTSPIKSSKVQNNKSPHTILHHHSDEYSDNNNHNDHGDDSSDIDDHPSDDDVLSVNIHQTQRHKNSMTQPSQIEQERTQSPTLSVLNRLSALKNKHEYNRSMSAIFAPNDYDGVINALDVLQSFCRNVPAQSQSDEQQSDDDDDGTHDSDDDVLRNDFDDVIMNEHDPFDTASEQSENMRNQNLNHEQIQSEYDELPFYNIGNSTIQSQTTRTERTKSTKSTHSSLILTPHIDTTNLDKNVMQINTKHARNETPIPLKTKYKSPKQQKQREVVQLNTMNMDLMNNKVYNREVRGNTLTPQSHTTSFLTTPIGHNNNMNNAQIAISPSHSFTHTEISMDNADDYEYRTMNDGGMKRRSHSHSIPGIISKDKEKKLTSPIMEEEEDENEIGILLKKPSIPGLETPNNTIQSEKNNGKFQRIRTLGAPKEEENNGNNKNVNLYFQSPSSLVLSLSPKSAQNQSMMSIDSMVAERSAFNEEIESTEYQSKNVNVMGKKDQRSKSLHKLRENKPSKRGRYYTHDHSVKIKRNNDQNHVQLNMNLAMDDNVNEHDAEKMGFISRKRKHSIPEITKKKLNAFEGGKRNTKKQSVESPRQYTQYKMRKNKEQQININNEYNINNGHLVMERKQSYKIQNLRWSKMIVLVALFVCFLLGVMVGVGVSWLLFV